MDVVDSVLMPKPRQRRPKDSFQNELQSKLYHRRSQGLTADITDSEEDIQTSSYSKEYQSSYSKRPGSAKRRPDRSPDLGNGLGTTTMRSRDLTQLLHKGGSHYDDDYDEDEEVMAANMGRSTGMSSWQTQGLKTPSPKQDPRYQRKTPTRESPKDSSRLDSIYGKHTPTRESPKEQGKLDSLFGRKTPTKDASPRGLSKEDIIFGRKTPTSSGDGHRLPGMDGKDKPWQPPSFRSVSPNSPTEHSRGSRGVTPTDSHLDRIDEGLTPRMQRGEHLRDDDSPRHRGDRPIPQSRSKIGDRKSPYADRKSPYGDRTSPLVDRTSPLADTKSPLADRRSPYMDRKSPLIDSSPSRDTASGMKRATPMYDLFGKSRTAAAQEVEEFIESDKKADPKYRRAGTKSPDGRKSAQMNDSRYKGQQAQEKGKIGSKTTGVRDAGRKTPTGKKTPTDYKTGYNKKSSFDKEEQSKDRKSPQNKGGSSLLDFLTEDTQKTKAQPKGGKGKQLDDELDDMFGSNKRYLANKSPTNQYKSIYDQRKSPLDERKPTLKNKKSFEDQERHSPDYLSRKKTSFDPDVQDYGGQPRRSPDMFEPSSEKPKKIPKSRKEDESSVCEEIPLDPNLQRAKAEEKALKSGKQTTDRAKANHAINSIADAQTMQYIEPAKKVRPVTAEAKVQHRPKPRYGTLPGAKTETLQREFSSTSDIRDAIYEQWYAERLKSAKQKKKEEEKKKAEEEEKKKKEEQERLQEAKLSYNAWMDMKKETVFREQSKKKRQEEMKKDREHREKQEKADEALKSFSHWKENKDAMIKHELQKKRRTEEEKQRDKEEEEYKKRKDRESAFKGWKSKKEREFEEQKRQYRLEKDYAKRKKEEEKEKERRKEADAMKKYMDWMEAKEKQNQLEKKRNKQRLLSEEDEYKPAWSPANRTIPFGR